MEAGFYQIQSHITLTHGIVVVRLHFQFVNLWETIMTIRQCFTDTITEHNSALYCMFIMIFMHIIMYVHMYIVHGNNDY